MASASNSSHAQAQAQAPVARAAVCYQSCGSDAPTYTPKEQRPHLNVPEDRGYCTQRFMNPRDHPDDGSLRGPLGFRDGMTESQSRERMAAMLGVYARTLSAQTPPR